MTLMHLPFYKFPIDTDGCVKKLGQTSFHFFLSGQPCFVPSLTLGTLKLHEFMINVYC